MCFLTYYPGALFIMNILGSCWIHVFDFEKLFSGRVESTFNEYSFQLAFDHMDIQ